MNAELKERLTDLANDLADRLLDEIHDVDMVGEFEDLGLGKAKPRAVATHLLKEIVRSLKEGKDQVITTVELAHECLDELED